MVSPTPVVTPETAQQSAAEPDPTAAPTDAPPVEVTAAPTENVAPTAESTATETITAEPTPLRSESSEGQAPSPTIAQTESTSQTQDQNSQPTPLRSESSEGQAPLNSQNTEQAPSPTTEVTATPVPPTATPQLDEQITTTVVKLDGSYADSNLVPSTWTDKADYAPTEKVVVSGKNFLPNTQYSITISSNDDPAVTHNGTFTTTGEGTFTYEYQLDGNYRPNYKVEVKDGSGTVVANTTFTDSYSAVKTVNNASCVGDLPGQDKLNCTANDISIASVTGITINGHGCRYPGDTVNFTADWKIHSTANQRYNVGLWFATAGQTSALNGTCSVSSLPTSPSPFFDDGDADTCGDIDNSTDGTLSITMTATCNPDSSGFLKLPYCTTWDNDGNNKTCSSPIDTLPGTDSKCKCDGGFTIPITVPPSIRVVKELSPISDSGLFDLQVNGSTFATNVGNAGDTGKQTANVGSNTFGELAGIGTDLSNYYSSVVCKDKNGTGNTVSTSGSNPWTINASNGQDILCTITNTRTTGSIELKKTWVGTGGQTTLNIGTAANGTNIATVQTGTSGTAPLTTGAQTVTNGTYYVSEAGGLADYDSSLSCTDNNVATTTGANDSVTVAAGHTVVCTFTNTLKTGTITVNKTLSPADDAGVFNLSVDGTDHATDVGNGGTTGAVTVLTTGTHTIGETAGTGTTLSDYNTTWVCSDDTRGTGTSITGKTVAKDTNLTCTFTNTRKTGKLELQKLFVGTTESVTLNIGTTQNGNDVVTTTVSGNGTTSEQTVSTGTYYVSESLTNAGNYGSSLVCYNDTNHNDTIDVTDTDHTVNTSTGAVVISENDDVICRYTNTRNRGTIELKKEWSGTGGQTTLNIGTTVADDDVDTQLTGANGTSPLTTGQNTVDTGTYYMSETGGLSNYTSALSCFNDANDNGTNDTESSVPVGTDNAVVVSTGQHVICTFINTRNTGKISIHKMVDTNGDGNYEITSDSGANTLGFRWGYSTTPSSNTTEFGGEVVKETGDYDIYENSVTGYHLVGWYVTGSTANSCKNPLSTSLPANLTVSSGETISITICNARDTGTIQVVKNVDPDDNKTSSWDFAISGPTNNTATGIHDTESSSSYTSATGDYSIGETGTVLGDYTTTYECLNGRSTVTSGTGTTASFTLSTGMNVVCTFTNTRKTGTIELTKIWIGTPGQTTLAIGTTAGASDIASQLTGADGTTDLTTGTKTVSIGTYYVSESDITATYSSSLSCLDNGTETTIGTNNAVTVAADHNVVCTFTNTRKTGSLTIYKDVVDPDGNPVTDRTETFTVATTGKGTQSLQDGDSYSYANIDTGSYTITETGIPTTYTLYGISTTAGGSGNTAGLTVEVNVGQTTVVYVTNKQKTSTITVSKDVLTSDGSDVADDHSFTAQLNGDNNESFSESTSATYTVNPGVYTVSELDEPGYDEQGCTLASGAAATNFTATSGGAIAVTCVNKQQPVQIVVHKQVDRDANGTYETLDPVDFTWSLNGNGTNAMGPTPVPATSSATHIVTENSPNEYHFTGWFTNGKYDREENLYSCENPESTQTNFVTVDQAPGTTGEYTFCNAHNTGTVTIDKITDPRDVEDVFTIHLTQGSGEDETIAHTSELADATDPDTFTVLTGTYGVSEATKAGWIQTDLICVRDVGEGTITLDPSDFTVAQDQHITCTVTNTYTPPKLLIAKSNNKELIDQSPGADVTYTLTVTAEDNNVNGVTVTDLPPKGFTYRGGSWTAHSSVRGDLKLSSITTEPTYHSPGAWTLGDMIAGEVVTLTYVADISNDQKPGTYRDLALAQGISDLEAEVIANDTTGTFVGTNVTVVKSTQLDTTVNVKREEKRESTGEVLGASTSLPSTGTDNAWTFASLALTFAGLLAFVFGLGMNKKKFGQIVGVLLTVVTAGMIVGKTHAITNTSIRLSQPKTPINQTFTLSFVALDLLDREITVRCYKKGPSDGGYSQFGGDIALIAGGNSGECPITDSLLSTNGIYSFYTTATATGDSEVTSPTVSVDFNEDAPSTPTSYSKSKVGSCEYKITFHTANDTDTKKTAKVEIYRSENTSFAVDGSNKVGEVSIGPNEDGSFTNTVPDCGKTYYYVIRAYNAFGNGSGVIGDSEVTITTITSTTTTTSTTQTGGGAVPVENANVAPGAGEEEVLGEQTETSSGEGQVLGEEETQKGTVLGKIQDAVKKNKYLWIYVLIAAVAALGLGYAVYKKTQDRNGE